LVKNPQEERKMVRRLILLLFLPFVFFIWSCAPTVTNLPPNTPSNPNPVDNATGVSIDVTLSWSCSDPDGDSLTYDIYFGTTSNPPLVKSNHTSTTYNPGTLNYNTTYYWKIVAKDGKEGTTEGPIWRFTTTGVPNNPPDQPSDPYPTNGSSGVPVSVTLSWTCTDPDGDTLTYDIYFGTTNPPPLVKSDHTSTSYNPGTLQYNTTYYWKIVAKDGKGGVTEGPVWCFKTVLGESLSLESRTIKAGRVYYLSAVYTSAEESVSGKDIKFMYYDPEKGCWMDLEDAITGESVIKTDEDGVAVIAVFAFQSATIKIKAFLVENPSVSDEAMLTVTAPNWAMLMFIAADNDLENAAVVDYQEAANTNENISVISIFDSKNFGDYFVVLDEYGYWRTISLTEYDGGDINTGDPVWLMTGLYMLYSIESSYKGLILWDHGSAWMGDSQYMTGKDIGDRLQVICIDETSRDGLAIAEVRSALEKVMDSLHVNKLDFLGMDACLMSSIEVAYELKGVSKYFLASAFPEPDKGWDYRFLSEISSNTDPEDLGITIVNGYFVHNAGTENLSLVLWDMSYISNLASAISDLGSRLLDLLDGDLKYRILSYYSVITHYGKEGKNSYLLTDIGDFVYLLKTYESDPELVEKSQNVEYWLDKAFVYGMISGEVYSTTYGLSLYFPTTPDQWNCFVEDINTLLFYTSGIVSGWGDFLYWFVQY